MLSVSEARARILAIFEPVETTSLSIARLAGRVLAGRYHRKNRPPPLRQFFRGWLRRASLRHCRCRPCLSPDPEGDCRYPRRKLLGHSHPTRRVRPHHDRRAPASRSGRGRHGRRYRFQCTRSPVRLRRRQLPSTNPSSQEKMSAAAATTCMLAIKSSARGTRLRAQEVGLLAMLGMAEVPVYRLPKVALLSSGDELLPVEAPLTPGKIHDANSYILAALSESAGVELIRLGVASDTEADVRSRLERAVEEKADVIISSAGVSVGAFDYVKSVVEADGELDFWKVNMRPGKPLAFGKYHGIPFFGLPGNPVSAFVGFEVFVRPALEKLSGQTSAPASTPESPSGRTGRVGWTRILPACHRHRRAWPPDWPVSPATRDQEISFHWFRQMLY